MFTQEKNFIEKDPVGYRRFISHARNIAIGRTDIYTSDGITKANTRHEVLMSYVELVNKLTNNNYYTPNSSEDNEAANYSGIEDIYNEGFIEAIVYGAVIEATNKKLYGVFTAFLLKFGNTKAMARLAMRFLHYSRATNDNELYNEILSSSIAPILIEKYPEVLDLATSSFTLDPNLGEQHYLRLADDFLSNMRNIAEDWNVNNNLLSTANISFNPDLMTILEANVLNNDTDFTTDTTDESFLLVAMELNNG